MMVTKPLSFYYIGLYIIVFVVRSIYVIRTIDKNEKDIYENKIKIFTKDTFYIKLQINI